MTEARTRTASDLERGVDAERSRTITLRLRLLALANIAVVVMFIAGNPTVHDGSIVPFVALRIVTVALLGAFLAATYRPSFARYQLVAAVIIATMMAGMSALGGVMRGDIAATASQHGLIVLAMSALLPWGARWQLVLVGICAMLLGYAMVRLGVPASGDPTATMLINAASGSLLSLFIAYQARRSFDRASRENLALRAAEENNRALNEQLEAMVRARTAELADALADQRTMARAISHDLRQPLRHIEGYTRVLEEELGAGVGREQHERFDRVRTATSRMWRMVDSLLAFSRVAVTSVARRPFNLSDAVQTICSDLQRVEPDRRVELVIQHGLVEHCDPDLVRQLLRELLANAWKFTRERDPGTIEFGCVSGIYFIRDNGPGFDMQHATRLFHAFERLHHSAEFEGEGMGLAICERIARRHGGRIWAESVPDQGATFLFALHAGGMTVGSLIGGSSTSTVTATGRA